MFAIREISGYPSISCTHLPLIRETIEPGLPAPIVMVEILIRSRGRRRHISLIVQVVMPEILNPGHTRNMRIRIFSTQSVNYVIAAELVMSIPLILNDY